MPAQLDFKDMDPAGGISCVRGEKVTGHDLCHGLISFYLCFVLCSAESYELKGSSDP